MTPVFADTFYWYALANPRDQWHLTALKARATIGQRHVITTEEVLTEFLAAMSGHPFLRISAKKLLESIFLSPYVSVIEQSHASFAEGLELYNSRPDKAYSLVDCISMTTCRKSGITEVLTLERGAPRHCRTRLHAESLLRRASLCALRGVARGRF